MKNIIIIAALFFIQCNNSLKTKKETTNCDEYKIKSAECISRFYNDDELKHLDTALALINKGLKGCDKYQGLFTIRKLGLFSLKKEYDLALSFIDSLDKKLFNDLPFYQKMLKNRFLAMKAQENNDYELRNSYLNSITDDINKYLISKKSEIDTLLVQKDINKILSNPNSTALTQYYYYKSIVDGKEKIEEELNNKQKDINGNKDFFDYLKTSLDEDFMNFIGM